MNETHNRRGNEVGVKEGGCGEDVVERDGVGYAALRKTSRRSDGRKRRRCVGWDVAKLL